MSDLIVVGGGTAGWLTAIYAKKYYPHRSIKVIASSEIGILGAGEGSTPHFIDFLKEIDITPADIVKHARGTFKNGIKFTNWNGDGQAYYRGLLNTQSLDLDIDGITDEEIWLMQLEKISRGESFDDIMGMRLISDKHQVKYRKNTHEQMGPISMHFDAQLLAKFLQGVAVSRGVEHIDDEVIEVNLDEEGFISGLSLKSGNKTGYAFYFDCSGFHRLIIGKRYKSAWKSYSDSLPVNRAIPFFIQNETNTIPPYTESIAMKHGWVWRIPVQGRYGCGYVFDNRYISDEEAKQEVSDLLGYRPEFPRVFDFNAGIYEQVCVKNCVAIGLSAGFIEPLEATSIWVQMTALRLLKDRIVRIMNGDRQMMDEFNSMLANMNEDILNFLHFHYLTRRTDSEFWRGFPDKTRRPDLIESIADMSKRIVPNKQEFDYLNLEESGRLGFVYQDAYNSVHYLPIGAGNQFFSREAAQEQIGDQRPNLDKLVDKLNAVSDDLMDHFDYIQHLKRH